MKTDSSQTSTEQPDAAGCFYVPNVSSYLLFIYLLFILYIYIYYISIYLSFPYAIEVPMSCTKKEPKRKLRCCSVLLLPAALQQPSYTELMQQRNTDLCPVSPSTLPILHTEQYEIKQWVFKAKARDKEERIVFYCSYYTLFKDFNKNYLSLFFFMW